MTVECVTLETTHHFGGNPLAEQHKLRYRTIIKRQDWKVPSIRQLEYHQYDNPATTYLIWRDQAGTARGVSWLYPTDRPFMLQEVFAHLVTYRDMPKGRQTWEGSRFCIDNMLDRALRQRIVQEILLSYLEYGLAQNIAQIIGVMYPAYWQGLFAKNGWTPVWIGDATETPDGKKSRAAVLELSEATLASVRRHTGIQERVLSYGREAEHVRAA